ncbi:hypothetical protein CDAR_613561 [Caerostris darwini]|uniref:Uncharacterized protein n=1 Tax=Caerostris darwini TaxID=1538125 RepID=A0AAV4RYF2_9ARAC|nr:hypothetical protein CDAR_613561 [Caerostris darwini]
MIQQVGAIPGATPTSSTEGIGPEKVSVTQVGKRNEGSGIMKAKTLLKYCFSNACPILGPIATIEFRMQSQVEKHKELLVA